MSLLLKPYGSISSFSLVIPWIFWQFMMVNEFPYVFMHNIKIQRIPFYTHSWRMRVQERSRHIPNADFFPKKASIVKKVCARRMKKADSFVILFLLVWCCDNVTSIFISSEKAITVEALLFLIKSRCCSVRYNPYEPVIELY